MFRQRQTKLAIKKLYQRNQQLQKAFRFRYSCYNLKRCIDEAFRCLLLVIVLNTRCYYRQHQTFAQPSTHRQFLTHDHSQRAMSDSISLRSVAAHNP